MYPKLSTQVLLDLVEHRRFGAEYEPIISLEHGLPIGYEALARFYHANGAPISPQLVFDSLHANPLTLFQVEYEMKRLQLAHAPASAGRLFVNLDPDAFQACAHDGCHPLVTLLSGHPGVVVEIIENSNINDADIGEAMMSAFAENNVDLALDDIGAPRTMLSLPILLNVNFLKFDRSWLQHTADRVRCAALRHLVAFARECGKRTILEGVEREAQLAFAEAMGFDYVQGFLYRPLFIGTGCLVRASAQQVELAGC